MDESQLRVYCTENGDYPKQGQLVLYQVVLEPKEYGDRITGVHIGFLLFQNNNRYCRAKERGYCPDEYRFYDFIKIYWMPYINLEREYEKQKGDS